MYMFVVVCFCEVCVVVCFCEVCVCAFVWRADVYTCVCHGSLVCVAVCFVWCVIV